MKRLTIANDPEQAAIEFAEQYEKVKPKLEFSMIPKSIGSSEKFWAKLVELKPEFISRVPEVIRGSESFAKLIDHQKFYNYIPKRFLTAQDFEEHKKSSNKTVSAYGSPVEISTHDNFFWVTYGAGNYPWLAVSKLTPEELFGKISEINPAKGILPELWSQKLADLIWESPMALVSYNAIPEEFVRKEWDELVNLFNEKRFPIYRFRNTMEDVEKLSEYWSQFKTEAEIKQAIKIEKLIERCNNPYGYSVNIDMRYVPDLYYAENPYEELWKTVEPIIGDNQELIEEFFNMYDKKIARFIPKEKFNYDWIKRGRLFGCYLRNYEEAVEALELAESEIEVLEAKDDIEKALCFMKETAMDYREMTDAEYDAFVAPYIRKFE